MATTVETKGWTVTQVRDFFPEPLDDTRYELIDGELHVSRQPDWQHQLTGANTAQHLNEWSRPRDAGTALHAPGVIFSEQEAVAPDVVWVSRERFDEVLDPDGHLRAAPDLMVEVLSPGTKNIRRDREAKLDVYSRRLVREYWIVDWRARTVDVYRRQGNVLQLAASLGAEDTLESPLLPGFSCRVQDFFRGIR
jgi:Uma2 family endonuclease